MNMKTLTIAATTAAVFAATTAQAACERPLTLYSGGELVTDAAFYDHGCTAFQHVDLDDKTAAGLIASGNCSVEATPGDTEGLEGTEIVTVQVRSNPKDPNSPLVPKQVERTFTILPAQETTGGTGQGFCKK